MEINSAFANALTGINTGMRGLDRNAAQLASKATMEGGDVTKPLVESLLNAVQVEANARVMKTVDETLGTLFDDMA